MPPKPRFRAPKGPKGPKSPNANVNTNGNQNHNKPNKHRNRSRSHSRKPFHEQILGPATTACNALTAKASHSLRSTLLTSRQGVLKRRVSVGISVLLPSASSERLKALLLQAVDDARDCVSRMDWGSRPSSENATLTDVPINVDIKDDGWGPDPEPAFNDSGIGGMDADLNDPWETETQPANPDHGCIDIVREDGHLVHRMRWEKESTNYISNDVPAGPRRMSHWGRGRGGRVRPNRSSFGPKDEEGWFTPADEETGIL